MQYGYTILYVSNVEKTVEFYEKAFGFTRKFLTPEKDYAELLSGETTIAFASFSLAKSNFHKEIVFAEREKPPTGIELAFVTETIHADFDQALQAGAVLYENIVQKPWGQQVGYLRDINGFLIEICTPMNS